MVRHLKTKVEAPAVTADGVMQTTTEMLEKILEGGEERALAYSAELDGFEGGLGDVIVSEAEFAEAADELPQQLKDDIALAHRNIKAFAEAQRRSIDDVSYAEGLWPGMVAGHRMVPLDCAGCYVPGGRFAHVASALMTVTTAKAAGVRTVVMASAPRQETGRIHPGVIFAAKLAGADYVLTLGGVQALGSMAYGLFTGRKANILVGPGNRFVVAAKQLLFGQVGVDLIAGPTEVCVLADADADPLLVATDLVGQAEHGFDSPAVLITTDSAMADQVMALVPELISDLKQQEPNTAAEVAWRDYGQVMLAEDREEMCALSDEVASEHLQVQCRKEDLGWYHDNLRNYGSLFLGEETNVSYGDKASGPNHVLPTRGAG